ncbi:uncharacterized protein LOC142178296 [Nicotiana tabacum]|uniref:Uncharacterized protein LOC142178296 n=1 Tax=Nicotiana tabacum TaxID=4097 RepID=A0AC58U2M2_TOBAC
MPSSVLANMSPYEKLYGKKPSLKHLKVLGCLCFAKIVQEQDKLMPRSKAAIHMGHATSQKGYLLYDFNNKTFFVNRDVIFKEDTFPFKTLNQNKGLPIFMNTNSLQTIANDAVNQFTIENHTDFQTGEVEDIHNITEDTNQQSSSLPTDHTQCTTSGTSQQHTSTEVTTDTLPSNITHVQSISQQTSTEEFLRKSSRDKRPPLWMNDFVSLNIQQDNPYALSKFISYENISPTYQSFIAASYFISEPTNYHEAIKDPRWINAMKAKIEALENNHTWDIVALPEGKSPIGCK